MEIDRKILILFHLTLLIALLLELSEGQIVTKYENLSPSEARNLRAKARFHFKKANEAQNNMFQAENDDDVDAYAKWLHKMREADQKMLIAAERYAEIRDYLEAKIWSGELKIDNFDKIHQKDALRSFFDIITFQAKY